MAAAGWRVDQDGSGSGSAETKMSGGDEPDGYAAFFLSVEGHVIRRIDLTATTEEDAKASAKKLATEEPVELWLGPRRIARFKPEC